MPHDGLVKVMCASCLVVMFYQMLVVSCSFLIPNILPLYLIFNINAIVQLLNRTKAITSHYIGKVVISLYPISELYKDEITNGLWQSLSLYKK